MRQYFFMRDISDYDKAEIARERASEYAPRPKLSPLSAGLLTAAAIAFALRVLFRQGFGFTTSIVVGAGFALSFAYFYSLKKRHDAAFLRELRLLRDVDEA